MRYIPHSSLIAVAILVSLLGASTVTANTGVDSEEATVRSRVARISLLSGDVQVRRAGTSEWESASVNLPLIEGDQLSTGNDARAEIQIDAYNFIRIGEKSFLSVVTLRSEGVALSLAEGTAILRLARFDRDHEYFEIDAPKTTMAVEKRGLFRLDATGSVNERAEVRITVRDGGQARVYSENSGFTLRDGRSARVLFDDTNTSGDWDLSAALSLDDWDRWNEQREYALARRLRYERRDRYYDSGVWGAEELDEYGDWVNAGDYGYVWRPYATVINNYYNWAPFRYGYWSWSRPFGWVWVANEPWGWAPYHYGRWVFYNGNWCWSPRNRYSYGHSWWQPALVVFVYINNSHGHQVCWYPLPPHHPNPVYATGGIKPIPPGTGGIKPIPSTTGGIKPIPPGTGGIKPIPPGTGGVKPIPGGAGTVVTSEDSVVVDTIDKKRTRLTASYLSAVSSATVSGFGSTKPIVRAASADLAETVMTSEPVSSSNLPVKPPRAIGSATLNSTAIDTNASGPRGPYEAGGAPTATGATTRKPGAALDDELRKTRIYNGREPLSSPTVSSSETQLAVPRSTGAVKRPERPTVQESDSVEPVRPVRPRVPLNDQTTEGTPQPVKPVRPPRRIDSETVDTTPPVRIEPKPLPAPQPPPKYEPPPKQYPPRQYDPPPRNDPPPKSDPPPRNVPPPKSDPPPRNVPPPKSDPPPRQSSDSSEGKKGKG